jgi:hypothetical protein
VLDWGVMLSRLVKIATMNADIKGRESMAHNQALSHLRVLSLYVAIRR